MNRNQKRRMAGGLAVLAASGLVAGIGVAGTTATASPLEPGIQAKAQLVQLNNSGVRGISEVTVDGRRLDVSVDARRLVKDMPHAQHIHFGAKARHECPTVRDDDNGDFRLDTAEGIPAYGPVKVSLTKRGDTSADSTLAVKRYPTAPNGEIHYDREIRTTDRIARGIRRGNAVVVIHGADYNHNKRYDFRSAGKSELDPNLPAEATDPVACGVLRVQEELPGS